MDHEVVLLSDHGPSLAGSWDALPEGNTIESSDARHLVVSSRGGGEFLIATSGEFTIGGDKPNQRIRRRSRRRLLQAPDAAVEAAPSRLGGEILSFYADSVSVARRRI